MFMRSPPNSVQMVCFITFSAIIEANILNSQFLPVVSAVAYCSAIRNLYRT